MVLVTGVLAGLVSCTPKTPSTAGTRSAKKPLPDSQCARYLDRVELMAERARPQALAAETEALATLAARDNARCRRRVRSFLEDLSQTYVRAYEEGGWGYYEPVKRVLLARQQLEVDALALAQIELALGSVELTRATRRYTEAAKFDPGDRRQQAEAHDNQALQHFRAALAGPISPDLRYQATMGQLATIDRLTAASTRVYTTTFQDLTCTYDQLGRCLGPRTYSPPISQHSPEIRRLLGAYDAYHDFDASPERAVEQVYWHLRRIDLWVRLDMLDMLDTLDTLDLVEPQLQALEARSLPPKLRAQVVAKRLDITLLQWLDDRREPELKALESAVASATEAQVAHPRLAWAAFLVREAQARETQRQATRNQAFRDFRDCAERFAALYNEQQKPAPAIDLKPVHQLAFLQQAIGCYRDAGLAGQMARLTEHMREQHPRAQSLPPTMIEVGRTLEQILLFDAAQKWYEKFLGQFPRHPRAPEARRRLVWTSVLLGDSIETQLTKLRRGSQNQRQFAAAIEFRTVGSGVRTPSEDLQAFLAHVDARDDRLRTVLAHTYLARQQFETSCPVDARAGPCVELTREKTLGQAVPRNPERFREAVKNLEAAKVAMAKPGWSDDPFGASFGPPLEIQTREVDEARALVELISGDILAETVLFTRPPYSREYARTRRWLELREQQLKKMVAAYRRITTPRFAATVAARQGLIYEADGGLLSDVASDLRRGHSPEATVLAAELQELANTRYEQARQAYNACLDQVQRWGQDMDRRADLCQSRLGQLLGHYDNPRIYAPELMDPLLLGRP